MKSFYVLGIWICLSGFRDSATDGTKIHGYIGKYVIITCSHSWASTNIKFFCRYPCEYRDVLVKSNWSPVGRYTLKDFGTGTFTVNITDLQESDSGIYWCGVERFIKNTHHEVNLKVSKDPNESITTSAQPHEETQTPTDLHTTTPAAHSEAPSSTNVHTSTPAAHSEAPYSTESPDALILSPSVTASSNATVLYAVGVSLIAVIIFVVGLIAVHQYRKKVKTSASTGSVTPVNKNNESIDEQEDCVYENTLPNTDSAQMKPIDRTEVPKSQGDSVYENVLKMDQSHEIYGNL